MNCNILDNKILILQNELDIYDAPVLKEKLTTVAAANNGMVLLDLNDVEDLTTPVLQVLIAAKNDLSGLRILNIGSNVAKYLKLFGLNL
jgi:anti-anti-sigma regulatory factor